MNENSQTRTPSKNVENLVLAGVLIALGTALSFVKVFDLPYGGSITLCSMLPVMLFSYRAGIKWGLGAGFTFSVLQLLFGLDALKGVLGLAGIFRGKIKNHPAAFTLGCLVAGLLRYVCSFLSGWILWGEFADVNFSPVLAGMSGQQLACFYSLVYNGSYMIPEILVTCVAAFVVLQFLGRFILKD